MLLVLNWYLKAPIMTDQPHPPILPRITSRSAHWHVGFDGGGTRTRAILATPEGQVVGQGQAGPSALGQGVPQAWRHLAEALADAAAQAGVPVPAWRECAVGAGLSGARLPSHARAFMDADPGCAALQLETDGHVGLLGAHGGAPGMLLVAGTGSVCEALRADGSRACAGGWGWRLGDEGSGAWIGQQAVRHAQRALDGRDAAGPLAEAMWQTVGGDAISMLTWCAGADQRAFAALAPLVFAQDNLDPRARALLQLAADELATLVLTLDPLHHLPLAVAGGVAGRLLTRWPAALQQRCVAPQADAASGALMMIRRAVAP